MVPDLSDAEFESLKAAIREAGPRLRPPSS